MHTYDYSKGFVQIYCSCGYKTQERTKDTQEARLDLKAHACIKKA